MSTPKLLIALLVATAALPGHTGEFYCCQDAANGRRVCGDTVPEQCRGRAYRVLDSAGNVVREVGPPLTPEQKAELALENKRKKQLEDAAREQRRRDQALLDTYASLEDIDLAQRKAEADVNFAIKDARSKLTVAEGKRRKFADEAEFYKKRTMPAELQKDLRAVEHEVKLLQDLIDLKTKDFETIKAKYDGDRRRYMELTGRRPVSLPPR